MSKRRFVVELTPDEQTVVIKALSAAAKRNEEVAREASREATDDKSNALIVGILRDAQTLTDTALAMGTPWEPEPQPPEESDILTPADEVSMRPFELEELTELETLSP